MQMERLLKSGSLLLLMLGAASDIPAAAPHTPADDHLLAILQPTGEKFMRHFFAQVDRLSDDQSPLARSVQERANLLKACIIAFSPEASDVHEAERTRLADLLQNTLRIEPSAITMHPQATQAAATKAMLQHGRTEAFNEDIELLADIVRKGDTCAVRAAQALEKAHQYFAQFNPETPFSNSALRMALAHRATLTPAAQQELLAFAMQCFGDGLIGCPRNHNHVILLHAYAQSMESQGNAASAGANAMDTFESFKKSLPKAQERAIGIPNVHEYGAWILANGTTVAIRDDVRFLDTLFAPLCTLQRPDLIQRIRDVSEDPDLPPQDKHMLEHVAFAMLAGQHCQKRTCQSFKTVDLQNIADAIAQHVTRPEARNVLDSAVQVTATGQLEGEKVNPEDYIHALQALKRVCDIMGNNLTDSAACAQALIQCLETGDNEGAVIMAAYCAQHVASRFYQTTPTHLENPDETYYQARALFDYAFAGGHSLCQRMVKPEARLTIDLKDPRYKAEWYRVTPEKRFPRKWHIAHALAQRHCPTCITPAFMDKLTASQQHRPGRSPQQPIPDDNDESLFARLSIELAGVSTGSTDTSLRHRAGFLSDLLMIAVTEEAPATTDAKTEQQLCDNAIRIMQRLAQPARDSHAPAPEEERLQKILQRLTDNLLRPRIRGWKALCDYVVHVEKLTGFDTQRAAERLIDPQTASPTITPIACFLALHCAHPFALAADKQLSANARLALAHALASWSANPQLVPGATAAAQRSIQRSLRDDCIARAGDHNTLCTAADGLRTYYRFNTARPRTYYVEARPNVDAVRTTLRRVFLPQAAAAGPASADDSWLDEQPTAPSKSNKSAAKDSKSGGKEKKKGAHTSQNKHTPAPAQKTAAPSSAAAGSEAAPAQPCAKEEKQRKREQAAAKRRVQQEAETAEQKRKEFAELIAIIQASRERQRGPEHAAAEIAPSEEDPQESLPHAEAAANLISPPSIEGTPPTPQSSTSPTNSCTPTSALSAVSDLPGSSEQEGTTVGYTFDPTLRAYRLADANKIHGIHGLEGLFEQRDREIKRDWQHEKTGDTLLHIAAAAGNEPLVAFLLTKGYSVWRVNKDARTPLGLARAARPSHTTMHATIEEAMYPEKQMHEHTTELPAQPGAAAMMPPPYYPGPHQQFLHPMMLNPAMLTGYPAWRPDMPPYGGVFPSQAAVARGPWNMQMQPTYQPPYQQQTYHPYQPH